MRGGSIVAVAPGFPDGDFQNHRLAIGNKIALVARQNGDQRQFVPLHPSLDAAQVMAANRNLVRSENEFEILVVTVAGQFGEHELIVRQ